MLRSLIYNDDVIISIDPPPLTSSSIIILRPPPPLKSDDVIRGWPLNDFNQSTASDLRQALLTKVSSESTN